MNRSVMAWVSGEKFPLTIRMDVIIMLHRAGFRFGGPCSDVCEP